MELCNRLNKGHGMVQIQEENKRDKDYKNLAFLLNQIPQKNVFLGETSIVVASATLETHKDTIVAHLSASSKMNPG